MSSYRCHGARNDVRTLLLVDPVINKKLAEVMHRGD